MEEEEEEGEKKPRKEAGLARRCTNRTPNTNENNVVVNQSVIPRTLEDLARDTRRILAAEKNANFVTKRRCLQTRSSTKPGELAYCRTTRMRTISPVTGKIAEEDLRKSPKTPSTHPRPSVPFFSLRYAISR